MVGKKLPLRPSTLWTLIMVLRLILGLLVALSVSSYRTNVKRVLMLLLLVQRGKWMQVG